MKCQLNSKRGTMKILATDHMQFSVLESTAYAMSVMYASELSWLQCSKSQTHTNKRTLDEMCQNHFQKQCSSKLLLPSTSPERLLGRLDYHQLHLFQVCPLLSQNIPPAGNKVSFYFWVRLPKIFNGTVNPKFSNKLPNITPNCNWSPVRSYP